MCISLKQSHLISPVSRAWPMYSHCPHLLCPCDYTSLHSVRFTTLPQHCMLSWLAHLGCIDTPGSVEKYLTCLCLVQTKDSTIRRTLSLTGYCELDNSLLWEASYPNDITHTAPTTLAALKTQASTQTSPIALFPLPSCILVKPAWMLDEFAEYV